MAVQQLLTLTESKDLPIEWKIELNRCVNALTDAARILLQTAIRHPGGNIEAEVLLQEGDALRLAGDETKAVRKYKTGHVSLLK